VTALQLYGVVPLEPGMNSPAGGTSLVGFRGIAAVVVPAPYRHQDPDAQAVADYAAAVERFFEPMPILPAPPGAIFRSRSVISRWLELHYLALVDALGSLEGSMQARATVSQPAAPLSEDTMKEWQGVAVESLRAEEARHSHLDFALSGPWPPYDFVRMQFGS
jgi:hypothetical protein